MSDAEIVKAVLSGNRDAYAGLVERYQRLVYAVAWSQLGNADLCEEAAQETFIKGFRYLLGLRNPDRFASWICSIARNVSTSLSRQHRRELDKRARWQLETVAATEMDGQETDPSLADTLRASLASLPDSHREAIVLFYLEGKRVKEAAALQGVSEEAMRTRLHRAREALRNVLEDRMETSLAGLAPKKELPAIVLPLLPLKPLASGIGIVWLSAAAAFGAMILMQVAFLCGFMAWYGKIEAGYLAPGPFRDLRVNILRHNLLVRFMLGLIALMMGILIPIMFGLAALYRLLAVLSALATLMALRKLRFNRSAFFVGQALSIMAMTTSFVLIAFFEFRTWVFFCALAVMNIILYLTHIGKPRRQDYSLFLRAQNGLLGIPQEGPAVAGRLTTPQLRAFVQFLGQHNLITDFRFRQDGLLLHLSPVVEDVIRTIFFLESSSRMHIDWQGRCQASLGRSDRRQLERLGTPIDDSSMLEEDVTRVVEAALSAFLAGETGKAEALLQAEPDKAVVIDTPRMLKKYRVLFGIPIVAASLLLLAFPFFLRGASARIVNTFSTGEATGSVTVSFWGRSTEETITAALYEASQGVRPQVDFPPASEESYRKSALQIQEGRMSDFSFINLKPGLYTVGVIYKKRGIVGKTRTLTSLTVNVPAGVRVEVQIRP